MRAGSTSPRLVRYDGLTVLLTTHYVEEPDVLADEVAIVEHGRVLVGLVRGPQVGAARRYLQIGLDCSDSAARAGSGPAVVIE